MTGGRGWVPIKITTPLSMSQEAPFLSGASLCLLLIRSAAEKLRYPLNTGAGVVVCLFVVFARFREGILNGESKRPCPWDLQCFRISGGAKWF